MIIERHYIANISQLISISARATISIPNNTLNERNLVSQLTRAWANLRLKYPILALQIKDGKNYTYKNAFSKDVIQDWADDTTQTYHLPCPFRQLDVYQLRDSESHQVLPDDDGNEAQM